MPPTGPWIRDRRWDLTWLIGSALVVPLGVLLVRVGLPGDAVNLGVTALVGGPHLFATFLATYADPRFRRRHLAALVAVLVVVPSCVVYLSIHHFQILLSVFIFWASLHVLQQNVYLTDLYRTRPHGNRRSGSVRARNQTVCFRAEPAWSRWTDYGLLMTSFYPIASYKLVHDDFVLGSVAILLPPFLKHEITPWIVSGVFGALLLVWMGKTLHEARTGTLHGPKTLLIGLTTAIAFTVPATAGGSRLELAFQAVNAWHSIQYLGLIWLVLALKRKRGSQESRWVASLSGPGGPARRFYALLFLSTAALLGGVFAVASWKPFPLGADQYYYMFVLSALLVHYAWDTYLFFGTTRGAEDLPLAEPMTP